MRDRLRNLAKVIPFEDFVPDRAEGDYLFDGNGSRLLDLNSGQFCAALGHSNPELAEVVANAAHRSQHTCASMVSESVIEAANMLNAISGEMDARTLLLSTGSEAVETCLRFAKRISGRDGVICFENGYHGLSLGSQSVTYSGVYARPVVGGVHPIGAPPQGDVSAEAGSLDNLAAVLEAHGEDIAVAIFEPIVSVGGLVYPSNAFFGRVKELLSAYGVLLAFDESQTGFGRVGSWFAFQQMGVVPDFVILSKAIGLGYPVAALLFSGEVADRGDFPITHYSSHQNDSFAAEIVKFGIGYIEEHGLLASNAEKGALFLDCLRGVEGACECFEGARGRGLMLGLDCSVEGVRDYRPWYREFHARMADEGVLIQGTDGGRVLRFLPSYLIDEHEIEFCCEKLVRVHEQMFGGGGRGPYDAV